VIRGRLIRVVNVVVVDDLDDVKQEDGNASVKELDISSNTKNKCFCQNRFNLKCYKSFEFSQESM
jgi:hypothetical protein